MPSKYPTQLDDFILSENDNKYLALQDAIRALQSRVGVRNSPLPQTLDSLLRSPGSLNPGHKHTLLVTPQNTAALLVHLDKMDFNLASYFFAGLSSVSGVRLISTPLLTQVVDGLIEYDGVDFYFTASGTRERLATGTQAHTHTTDEIVGLEAEIERVVDLNLANISVPELPTPLKKRRYVTVQEDFMHTNGNLLNDGLAFTLIGAGASVTALPSTAQRAGIVGLNTGSTATGRAGVYSNNLNCFAWGASHTRYESSILLPVLSTDTNSYVLRCGWGDTLGTECVDGVYFRYQHKVNGGCWQCVVRVGSSETVVDTMVVINNAEWVALDIEVNEDGSVATFWINAQNVATMSGLGLAGRESGFIPCLIQKQTGLISAQCQIDFCTYVHTLTGTR